MNKEEKSRKKQRKGDQIPEKREKEPDKSFNKLDNYCLNHYADSKIAHQSQKVLIR